MLKISYLLYCYFTVAQEFSDVKDSEKKQRKIASAISLSDLKMILEEKEKAKKVRHEQRQELFRQSITSHEHMMDKLLDKLREDCFCSDLLLQYIYIYNNELIIRISIHCKIIEVHIQEK